MPSKGSRGVLGFSTSQLADALDEVAKELTAGTITKGRAIRLGGAALLCLRPRCRGRARAERSSTTKSARRSNSGRLCSCFKTVSGNTRCIDVTGGMECPTADECDRTRDCPGDQICVKIGGCCEGSRRNVCANPCP